MLDRSDIDLYLFNFCWSPFLKKGITLTCFKISVKVPGEKDKLISVTVQ